MASSAARARCSPSPAKANPAASPGAAPRLRRAYRMVVQAAGERLVGKLGGAKILAAADASLASGRVGLNVLDGRAA
ncbi:hypothetical protein FCN77_02595 [Arthrobacter sp. 24S4-2]|uniref:hypothetical protein n=1 Tax=Arthrobacter sp. 24S4-2 TaxID=2575374 RepID=UPI0010C772AF|nr:hypothetical protein [Arthrobacter sp. 24S4-2]QCO96803.1 hypothetical protein FCN77_02595 [Arthrobacter sp. 24S4-2]